MNKQEYKYLNGDYFLVKQNKTPKKKKKTQKKIYIKITGSTINPIE